MAGLRNVRTNRIHKERGQLKHRLHLGELEKKVDYRKRKEIYQKKKKIEKVLKEKQMNKNPDEFHTGMVHTQITEDGNLEKKKRTLKYEHALNVKRNNLKEDSRWTQYELKQINNKIEQFHVNIPFRYIFNNSHVIYNGDETYPLKAENKKLKKKGAAYEEEYNSLIQKKNAILGKIKKLDNAIMKTYISDDCYYVRVGGNNTYQLFGPRLK